MPLQQTSGNDTSDAYGGGAAVVPTYIEDVFSTYLYTGNGTSQTITNNIDLSGKGGLTWLKSRSAAEYNSLFDTARGVNNYLFSNATNGNTNYSPYGVTAFNSNGFSISGGSGYAVNTSAATYVSWTFREQPKFFDIVTYTGTGSATTIAHSLGSVPGCIIVKRIDSYTTSNWQVYHNGLTSAAYSIQLNLTAAQASATTVWNSTSPTSAVFSVGTDATVNASGGTYVAYIYASNAGGFGSAGTDNVITCGSSATDASGNWTTTLGYEPQWVLWKSSTGVGSWEIIDNMRNFSVTDSLRLFPNLSIAEANAGAPYLVPSATGFSMVGGGGPASGAIIYIAIRRGPMKTPTDATTVFNTMLVTGNGTNERQITGVGFPPDLLIGKRRSSSLLPFWFDKLRGKERYIDSSSASSETALAAGNEGLMLQDGFVIDNNYGSLNVNGSTYADWVMRRAPGFFDEVCYTGTGSYPLTVAHNLGVAPELIITKTRSSADGWYTYAKPLTSPNANWYQNYLTVNNTSASTGDTSSITTAPTSTTITYAGYYSASGVTYVNYLFATLAGVSKVGTYTGNGTTQTINCGFTGGARFVLIKRTDSTGDWYVYDTARGMTTLTDPYLLMNSTAAETATLGSVTTVSTGFALNSTILAAINVSGGTYIYLAIA